MTCAALAQSVLKQTRFEVRIKAGLSLERRTLAATQKAGIMLVEQRDTERI